MSLIQENCFASVSGLQLEPSFPDRGSQSTRNWLSRRPAPSLVSGVSAGTALSPQRQCLVWSPTDLSAPVSPCGCWRHDAVSELASSLQPFLVVRWCISHVCYRGSGYVIWELMPVIHIGMKGPVGASGQQSSEIRIFFFDKLSN